MIRFRAFTGRIVLFAGTSEGRELAERFMNSHAFASTAGSETRLDVYVTSDYGASLLPEDSNLHVHVGCFLREDMQRSFQQEPPELVIDATHPYAAHITETLISVCAELSLRYVRIRRPASVWEMPSAEKTGSGFSVGLFDSIQAAVCRLRETKGNVLITTGAKELAEYAALPDFSKRCFLRALPTAAVLETSKALGLPGDRLCLMQGPFSTEMNLALIRHCNARFLVTKASGLRGGFGEKWEAAEQAGISLLIIGRPEEPALPPGGILAEVSDFS